MKEKSRGGVRDRGRGVKEEDDEEGEVREGGKREGTYKPPHTHRHTLSLLETDILTT